MDEEEVKDLIKEELDHKLGEFIGAIVVGIIVFSILKFFFG